MKVIGIVGSRRRDSLHDLALTEKAFNKVYEDGDTIVSGGCSKGGDRFAEIIARQIGCPIKIYHANWKKYGKSAGFERNTYIASDSLVLIAVVAEDRIGGTEDTIKKFIKSGGTELILV